MSNSKDHEVVSVSVSCMDGRCLHIVRTARPITAQKIANVYNGAEPNGFTVLPYRGPGARKADYCASNRSLTSGKSWWVLIVHQEKQFFELLQDKGVADCFKSANSIQIITENAQSLTKLLRLLRLSGTSESLHIMVINSNIPDIRRSPQRISISGVRLLTIQYDAKSKKRLRLRSQFFEMFTNVHLTSLKMEGVPVSPKLLNMFLSADLRVLGLGKYSANEFQLILLTAEQRKVVLFELSVSQLEIPSDFSSPCLRSLPFLKMLDMDSMQLDHILSACGNTVDTVMVVRPKNGEQFILNVPVKCKHLKELDIGAWSSFDEELFSKLSRAWRDNRRARLDKIAFSEDCGLSERSFAGSKLTADQAALTEQVVIMSSTESVLEEPQVLNVFKSERPGWAKVFGV